MILVRYATLVALVFWLAAMMSGRFDDVFRRADLIAYAAGATMIVGLFILKFVGPPPIAFVIRAGLAVLMIAIAAGAAFAPRGASSVLTTVNIGLGLVLLVWYVRE